MTNMIVRDRPAANSVFEWSNCRVTSAIISKVIVGKYVFVRWYEIILFSFMSTCSLELSVFKLNAVLMMLNCERVFDPLNINVSARRTMLPIKSLGCIS
jgi:hypothetical protein